MRKCWAIEKTQEGHLLAKRNCLKYWEDLLRYEEKNTWKAYDSNLINR